MASSTLVLKVYCGELGSALPLVRMTEARESLSFSDKLRDWLLYTGRFIESFEEFVQALGTAMRAYGLPIDLSLIHI